MTNYREVLRLAASGYSKSSIAKSVSCSRNTVTSVLDSAKELDLEWPRALDLSDLCASRQSIKRANHNI